MPKIAVDENSDSRFGESEVRAPRQFAIVAFADDAARREHFGEDPLGSCVLAADLCHYSTTGFAAHRIAAMTTCDATAAGSPASMSCLQILSTYRRRLHDAGNSHDCTIGLDSVGALRLKAKISETTDRDQTLLDAETIVTRLNQMLAGWANYFCRGPVSEAYRTIDFHVRQRIRRWLVAKHKGSGRGINQYPNEFLYEEMGLIRLATWRTNYLRGRKA